MCISLLSYIRVIFNCLLSFSTLWVHQLELYLYCLSCITFKCELEPMLKFLLDIFIIYSNNLFIKYRHSPGCSPSWVLTKRTKLTMKLCYECNEWWMKCWFYVYQLLSLIWAWVDHWIQVILAEYLDTGCITHISSPKSLLCQFYWHSLTTHSCFVR